MNHHYNIRSQFWAEGEDCMYFGLDSELDQG